MRFSLMERLVGLFLLTGFFLLLFSVVLVGRGQNWFKAHNNYFAVYKEGYNLQPGVKVKLLRTDIGQVTGVELTDKNQVKVFMKILAEYADKIQADSQAAIESPTFIGSEYINIIPGTNPEAPKIPPGGQIPSREQKAIGDYLAELNLEHKLLKIDEILENIKDITDTVSESDGPLFGTLDNLKEATGKVAEGKGSIGRIVNEDDLYNALLKDLEKLGDILNNVEKVSTSVQGAAKSAEKVSADVSRQVPDMTSRIQNILEKMESVAGKLETAMNDVPEISQEARRGMRDVNRILQSVKKNFLIRGNLPAPPEPQTHGVIIQRK